MDNKLKCQIVSVDDDHRIDCVGLIKCIKEWKSWICPEEDHASVGDFRIGVNTSQGVFEYWKPQHLYLVSERKINEGDIYLHKSDSGNWLKSKADRNFICNHYIKELKDKWFRAEASTHCLNNLPLIHTSIIRYFVNKNGKNLKDITIELSGYNSDASPMCNGQYISIYE